MPKLSVNWKRKDKLSLLPDRQNKPVRLSRHVNKRPLASVHRLKQQRKLRKKPLRRQRPKLPRRHKPRLRRRLPLPKLPPIRLHRVSIMKIHVCEPAHISSLALPKRSPFVRDRRLQASARHILVLAWSAMSRP